MKSSKSSDRMKEQGRVIARAMDQLKVEKKKNMIEAGVRREKTLHAAAEQALSGFNIK